METGLLLRNLDADDPDRAGAARYRHDEVQAMVRAAYERGLGEARAEERAREAEAARAAAAELEQRLRGELAAEIARLADEAASFRRRLEADLVGFAEAVAERLLPEIAAGLSHPRVAAELRGALRAAAGSRRVIITVAPGTRTALAAEIDRGAEAHAPADAVRIETDAGLGAGDLRMAWDGGSMDYSHDRIVALLMGEIRAVAARYGTPLDGEERDGR